MTVLKLMNELTELTSWYNDIKGDKALERTISSKIQVIKGDINRIHYS